MQDCLPHLPAAYALAALAEPGASAFARHLVRCPACRAETASLLEAASSLALAVPPADPPPALRERILEAIGGPKS